MTREEAIVVLKNEQPHCGEKALFPEEKKYEAYDLAIKALEQEPCDDCVRRREVLDVLKDTWNMFSDANDAMQESINAIKALKSVTPRKGELTMEIKCPHDLNQFLIGEPIFEDPFPKEECEQRKFYEDCFHCFSTAIASRDHQLKNTAINKIKAIVPDKINLH